MSSQRTISKLRKSLTAAIASSLAEGHTEADTFSAVCKALGTLTPGQLASLSDELFPAPDPGDAEAVVKGAIEGALLRGQNRSQPVVKSEVGIPMNRGLQQGAGAPGGDLLIEAARRSLMEKERSTGHVRKSFAADDARQAELEARCRKIADDIKNPIH